MGKIVTWAQNTFKFNAILVLLENPERIPTQVFNVFVSTLSSMRCLYGIPIGLALCSISKELIQKQILSNAIDSSSLHGETGFILDEFSFVNTRSIVGKFRRQFWVIKACLLVYFIFINSDSESLTSLLWFISKMAS